MSQRHASSHRARCRTPAGKASQPWSRRFPRAVFVPGLRCSVSQHHRFAVVLQSLGARLPLRFSHAPPRPPPAHSAQRPKARAAPPILGCGSPGCCACSVVSASLAGITRRGRCRLVVAAGRAIAPACKPWGAAPNPARVAGCSGAGGEKHSPSPPASVFFTVPRQGCALRARLRRPLTRCSLCYESNFRLKSSLFGEPRRCLL